MPDPIYNPVSPALMSKVLAGYKWYENQPSWAEQAQQSQAASDDIASRGGSLQDQLRAKIPFAMNNAIGFAGPGMRASGDVGGMLAEAPPRPVATTEPGPLNPQISRRGALGLAAGAGAAAIKKMMPTEAPDLNVGGKVKGEIEVPDNAPIQSPKDLFYPEGHYYDFALPTKENAQKLVDHLRGLGYNSTIVPLENVEEGGYGYIPNREPIEGDKYTVWTDHPTNKNFHSYVTPEDLHDGKFYPYWIGKSSVTGAEQVGTVWRNMPEEQITHYLKSPEFEEKYPELKGKEQSIYETWKMLQHQEQK